MAGLVSTNIREVMGRTWKIEDAFARYGISYNVNDSNPALTRLYNSVDMVANVGNSLTDNPKNDFDLVYPFKEITQETINSRVMMKIPKFYIRRELIGNVMEIVICKKKYDDSYIPHEMFLKGNTQWTGSNPETDYNDFTYVSKYEISSNNQSVSNATVQGNQTIVTMRTNANIIGSGWSILDIATWDGLQKLFMIVFATRNSRSIMRGNYSISNVVQKTGLTNASKASCVQISDTAMAFYGIENLYNNISKFVDGINFNIYKTYICTDISKYASNTSTNYVELNGSQASETGYIKTLCFDINNKFAQIPTSVGASSSTYFTDEFNPYIYGWKSFAATGSTGSQTQYALFSCNLPGSDSSGDRYGSRLIYRQI